jgi:C-terminal processing protease CtpA/Prc
MLGDDVAYLRVYEFVTAATCDQFSAARKTLDVAMDELARGQPRAWILDLRTNGGGYMPTGAYVSGRLGLEGEFVSFRARSGSEGRIESLGNNAVGAAPLVVLVDAYSASTSEITAFALQDAGKAYVIGEQTAGAVVGTNPWPVNGGAVFITSYLVEAGPKQKRIDKVGVTPDKKVELDLELLRREGRDSQLEAATAYLRQKLGR